MSYDYKELPIVQKSWEVDFSKLENYDFNGKISLNAVNSNKARFGLWVAYKAYGHDERFWGGGEVTQLNLPIKRYYDNDIVIYDGKEMNRDQVNFYRFQIEKEKRLDDILNDATIVWCYIPKQGSYYCPNYSGYTGSRLRAGVYTKEDAVKEAKGCDLVDVEPIDVERHNACIMEEINLLKKGLIE